MNALRNIYWAVRYGEWGAGWGQYPRKPQLGFYVFWHDCQHAVLHVGPLWISVSY